MVGDADRSGVETCHGASEGAQVVVGSGNNAQFGQQRGAMLVEGRRGAEQGGGLAGKLDRATGHGERAAAGQGHALRRTAG